MKKELNGVELNKIAGGMITGSITETEDGNWRVSIELNFRTFTGVFATKRKAEQWKRVMETHWNSKFCPFHCSKQFCALKKYC